MDKENHNEASSLRAAIQYAILQTVGLTSNEEKEVAALEPNTASAIATLTELTLHYATQLLAPDLQQFSRHAGKSRITEQDVLLFIRRSPEHIQSQVRERLQEYAEVHKRKEIKRLPPVAASRPKPRSLNLKKKEDSSSSDSDSLTTEVRVARIPLPKPATAITTKALYSATSSDEEEMERIQAKLRHGRRSVLPKGTSPLTEPKSRFRLPVVAKEKANSTGRRNDDSSSTEEEEFDGKMDTTTTSQNQRLRPTKTTTQQYIANLSQDSLLSDTGL
jgi:CENP-S protein